MDRIEFIIFTAIVLFLVFLLGWFAYWLIHNVVRVTTSDMGELDKMAKELHETSEERDEAVHYLHQREAELNSKITQLEAELSAAMDGLRESRHEAEDLRAYIEKINAS